MTFPLPFKIEWPSGAMVAEVAAGPYVVVGVVVGAGVKEVSYHQTPPPMATDKNNAQHMHKPIIITIIVPELLFPFPLPIYRVNLFF
jgi:hypothetical protein